MSRFTGPRPTRDCPHGGAHDHGTISGYKYDRCRCDPCSTANARACKSYAVRRVQGRTNSRVPAPQVTPHLERLIDAGATYQGIAEASGVGETTVRLIHQGKRDTVGKRTANRLLALTPRSVKYTPGRVDVTGSRRRLQALSTIGYSANRLSRLLGLERSGVLRIISEDAHAAYQWIGSGERDRVTAVYDFLWNSPADGSTRAERAAITGVRNRAIKRGWLPPMAWDDDRIDDPNYHPNNIYWRAS